MTQPQGLIGLWSACVRRDRWRWHAALVGLVIWSLGCNIMSLSIFLAPEPSTEAAFTLPRGSRALIVLDHPNVYPAPGFAPRFHESLKEELLNRKLVSSVVPFSELETMKQNDPQYAQVSIQRLLVRTNADVAIHVTVSEFRLRESPTDPQYKGYVQAQVKVVDRTGERLFPTEGTETGGRLVESRTGAIATDDRRFADRVTRTLAEKLGFVTATNFYKFEDKELRAVQSTTGDMEESPR